MSVCLFLSSFSLQEEELRTVREVLRAQQAAWEEAGVQVLSATPGAARLSCRAA